jgi:hypothetical protein
MALIAQQKAVEFERQRAAEEDDDAPIAEIATEGDDGGESEEE